jgi:acyl-CoA synthetase (AMP-forming)/AMP-acid ligase II
MEMKKETIFALFVITLLSFALIAGITPANAEDTEPEITQTPPKPNDTSSNDAVFTGDAELGRQLQELINSDYFKQLVEQWRAEKAAQDPGYEFEDIINTKDTTPAQTGNLPAHSPEAPAQSDSTPGPIYASEQTDSQTDTPMTEFNLTKYSLVIILCIILPMLSIAFVYKKSKTARQKK